MQVLTSETRDASERLREAIGQARDVLQAGSTVLDGTALAAVQADTQAIRVAIEGLTEALTTVRHSIVEGGTALTGQITTFKTVQTQQLGTFSEKLAGQQAELSSAIQTAAASSDRNGASARRAIWTVGLGILAVQLELVVVIVLVLTRT